MKISFPGLLQFLLVGLLFLGCKSNEKAFTKKAIKASQKLIGLDFDNAKIKTMHGYLLDNRAGYDSLRLFDTPFETFPAMMFDPHPLGFVFPTKKESSEITVREDVLLPADLQELAFYTIPQLASLLKSKKISSTQLTQLYLDRIKEFDSQLLSVITVTDSMALAQAKRADLEIAAGNYRGILHGIPYGVKDLMAVKGYPTTWGAEPYRNQQIDYTAEVVQRLEASGAVLIAKLVSGSLARGDVWFGGKTKNPWDLTQGASGSSAGSGSATAAGLVAFSLGTETLGSIVGPASRNGVTGLRPTYGRVSRHGVMSLSWSMDKIGPITRSAEDAAIVFEAIYGKDMKDPSTNEVPFNRVKKQVSELKIAYLKAAISTDTTDAGKNLQATLEVFKEMGAELDSVGFPANFPYAVFDIILRAEAGANFDVLVRSGAVDTMVEQQESSRANSLRQSRFIPAVEYLQANRQRRLLIEEFDKLISQYDVIIAPTSDMKQLMGTNLTGHPVICLPNGLDKKGRPTSFTMIGNLYDEGSILALAMAYQKVTDFEERRPPLFSKKKD